MLTKLMIGIDVIIYGLANLGYFFTMRGFYIGLVVLGIVYLLDTFYGPATKRFGHPNTAA